MLDTTMFTRAEGSQVRISKSGEGRVVILLHGYPDNLQVFANLAPLLATHNCVIAFDWPGMGASTEGKGGAAPINMAKKLLSLMDEWNVDKADLIAQDMGGQPALVFASMFPHRVNSVVIMNSLVMGAADTSWEIKWLRKFGVNRLLLRHFGWLVFRRALYTFLPSGFHLPQDIQADMWSTFRTQSVRAFVIRMCAGYEAQLKRLPEYYRTINCPVLILWGEKDKHFPPIQAKKLLEKIPHAKLKIRKDATHWMVLTMPTEIANDINTFLKDCQ